MFALALVAAVIVYAWPFVKSDEFPAHTSGRLLSAVIGLGLMISVLFYSRKLTKAGVLK